MTRRDILDAYADYAQSVEDAQGYSSRSYLFKPLHNLFHGEKNAKLFRRSIDLCRQGGEWGDIPVGDAIRKCKERIAQDVLDRR